MTHPIHGTRRNPSRQHPVLDIDFWERRFPLGDARREGNSLETPGDLAMVEQARRLASTMGDLGPSVPADIFTWSFGGNSERPWLTRIGGIPWREQGKHWPVDSDGIPLHFLGQICFVDSRDILPCDLPGDVALIFGRWEEGWCFPDEHEALEWSSLKLKEPESSPPGWTCRLPFCYAGVVHRTVQYTDEGIAEDPFKRAGWKKGGWGVHSVQGTCISSYADLPQGWPFAEGDGNRLIATLSSFYFRGQWPLCDVPQTLKRARDNGEEYESTSVALDFGIGDAGAIWIYCTADGEFRIESACG
jgi:hypothetical protein